ncbi:autotransporter outer membrane beta-barrel domain-containing protein [Rubritalea marina]|uniref:autotransporter family protein n=1 Tax=Rubritalea marina TaxID=361055 RepID=UPI00035F8D61|nr:autotransporter outer membrane beta-barrel domain-containing protein [Rubritalea marina]
MKVYTTSQIVIGIIFSLPISKQVYAADTVCDHTGSTAVDPRSFPTSPGFTVINGRNDGSTATCIVGGTNSSLTYPNSLTINSMGTGMAFVVPNINISNGLTIDDGGSGSGLVTMYSNFSTNIQGDVHLTNNAQFKLITHNTGSSTTRLHVENAYFNIDSGSTFHVEFNLDSTTGQYISLGAIQGDGDIRLTNIGKSNNYGDIIVNNGDGNDYTYNGNIIYDNQGLPQLTKRGTGKFTFNGDVNKASGDSLGFTDGFGYIEVNEGELQITSNAFVYGTRTTLNGGSLIFDQSFDADIPGATFQGSGRFIKRGTSKITLHGISRFYKGDLSIEAGTLGLAGDATLVDASSVSIDAGATLDISQVYSNTEVSRLYGDGAVELGTKTLQKIIQLSPGNINNGIGTLSFNGSGALDLSGTKYSVNMDPTQGAGDLPGTTHDQVQVAGAVHMNTLPVISLVDNQMAQSPSAYLNGREFTVITAASGLSKLPTANIVEDAHSFHAFVGAEPESTTITDQQVKVRFGIKTAQQVVSSVAQTPTPIQLPQSLTTQTPPSRPSSSSNKQQAAQQYIQQTLGISGNQSPTQAQLNMHPALQGLTTAGLAFAASQNNPEAYSSNLTIGLEATDLISNMALSQASRRHLMRAQSNDSKATINQALEHQQRLWIDTAFTDGSVTGASNVTGNFDYDIFGIAAGYDLLHNQSHTTGIFIGGAFSRLKEHDHINHDIDSNYFLIGLYNQHRLNNGLRLNTLLNGFYGESDASRLNHTTSGGIASSSSADFASQGVTLGAMLEKDYLWRKDLTLTPSIGALYTYLKQNGFNESGGGSSYDYQVESADAQALLFSAGCDLTHRHEIRAGEFLTKLRLRYEYDAYADQNSAHDIRAGLGGISSSTFVGQNRGPHGLIAGLGVEAAVTQNCQVGAGYLYAWRSHGHESSLGGNISIFW